MANGNRDVSLVIRAKNEASRTLGTITSALDTFKKSQDEVSKSGNQTGSTLDNLAKELDKLSRAVGGSGALNTLGQGMDRARTAVKNLGEESQRQRQNFAELEAQQRKLEASTSRIDQRQQQLTGTLAQQRDATARAKQEYQQLAAALQQAERITERSGNQQQKLIDRMTRQSRTLENTRARYRELLAQISAAEAPSARLQDRFEQVTQRLQRHEAALSRTREAYREQQQASREAANSITQLRQEHTAAQQTFDRSRNAMSRTQRALDNVTTAAKQQNAALAQNATASARAAQAMERTDATLTRAREEMVSLSQSSQQAEAALASVGNTVRRQVLTSLREATQETARYRREWEQAQNSIRNRVQAGGSTTSPSPEMARDLQTAREAKAAYEQNRQAVHQYRQAIREAGNDVTRLTAAQQQFAAATARVNQVNREAAQSTRSVTQARRADTQAVRQNSEAMDALERRGRAAMTWAQRLRGEVIALTLSYVGLYAAIQQLQGVTSAFMELEAAQNRMLVAFNGNEALSAREMRWVREEADKLGIQFGILAQEYSKFAIAARGSNLEGAEARRIFEAVTVAARVNKLSMDQMEGTFLALSQMMSKGVVSMEELRRQMGDRLYGAFTLAAEAMGITAAELDSLVSSGSLFSERFLPKFADRLEEVFGPQLGESLDTFTTDLGRFQNELFKTQLRVAEAGFIDGLRDALNSLSEFFQSDEGVRFFESLGAAAGNTARFLAEIPKYFREITFVISALMGVRIFAWLQTLQVRFGQALAAARPLPATLNATTGAATGTAGAMTRLNAASAPVIPTFAQVRSRLQGAAVAMRTAQGRAVVLTRAMTGLRAALAMVGGIPGLLITGLSIAFTAWATGSRGVADTTTEHEEQMNRLLDEYTRVAEAAGDWAARLEEGINGVSLDSARQNFRRQTEQLQKDTEAAFRAVGGRISDSMENLIFRGRTLSPLEQQVASLGQQMRDGQIGAQEYQKALSDMLKDESISRRLRDLIENNAELSQTLVEQEARTLEAAAAVVELGGSVEELDPRLRALVPTLEELAQASGLLQEATPADPYKALSEQLEILRGQVPSLREEMRLMEQLSSIDEIIDTATAIEGIDQTSEAFRRFLGLAQQAKNEIQDTFDARRFSESRRALATAGASSSELTADLLRRREGYRETPYWDVNAYRAGFGSDTVTLADGSVQAVTQGMRVSVVDANRDLMRRIEEFQSVIIRQVGQEAWGRLNPQQQAVLTSNAYNYGSLQEPLRQAVRAGSLEGIQQALRNQAGHNNGVNRERRQEEAFLFGQSADAFAEANQQFVQQSLQDHERLVEQQTQYNDQLATTLDRRFQDTALVAGLTREMAIARALEDERANAAKVGLELTQAQEASIANAAALNWDLANADKESSANQRQLEQIAERINVLLQFRKELMEQIVALEAEGNLEGAANIQQQVEALDVAIATAQEQHARYQAAIKQTGKDLKDLAGEMEKTAQTAILTSETIGMSLGENLSRGMDGFLDRVRETGSVIGSAREAFLQFAADFTLQLAKMIAQQALLNLLTAALGPVGGGFWGGVIQGVGGGVMQGTAGVGGGGTGIVNRQGYGTYGGGGGGGGGGGSTIALVGPSAAEPSKLSENLFRNAVRYHTGGIAGLAPNEVPAVLERGEEVLAQNDPRHRDNQQSGNGESGRGTTFVLVDDKRDMVAAMASSAGDDVILNYLKRNRKTVRQFLR